MITIDGSYGEGGGQILRTSLSLSAITGIPFTISNIRSFRKNPGLRPQHLKACLAAREITNGILTGAEIGSQTLTFYPDKIQSNQFRFDIGTAGSVVLLAQTLVPILLFAKEPTKLDLIGGTHVKNSPGYDYFEHIFLGALKQFGINIQCKLQRVGYYPKGGGKIEIEIKPQIITSFKNKLQNKEAFAIIRISHLPEHVALREKLILNKHNINNISICENNESLSPGNAITLCKGLNGSYVLGKIGKKAEKVAKDAYLNLANEIAEVDQHLSDQLLIYAALAEDSSFYTTSRITDHLKTNIFVINHFIQRKIHIINNTVHIL